MILLALCCWTLQSCAQEKRQDYLGNWIGTLPDKHSFNFQITLESYGSNEYQLRIANTKPVITKNFTSVNNDHIQFNVDNQLHFNLKNDNNELTGYIKSGKFYYYVTLQKTEQNKYIGNWNPFMLDNGLTSDELFLNIDHYNGQLEAYPFLGDQRSRGFWANDFKKKDSILSFRDDNTGFNFRAIFLQETIEFEMYLIDALITKTTLTYSEEYWEPPLPPIVHDQSTDTPSSLDDGWATGNIKDYGIDETGLKRLIDSINIKALVNTHSVLITKKNKLVFEAYFDGFNANIPHDLRSASKSISSAIIGIAIDDKIIESVDEKLYDFIPENYQYTKDSLKSAIKIKDLLTMSSGLDVNNLASEENYQNSSRSKSWLQTVLEAPMVKTPGTYADYGSANPFLLGMYLNERLEKPLEDYMDEKLFAPLGITNYINQTDDTQVIPYFGGGMLLTPRDLLKFGQLYLNKGKWNGKQIISESWVTASFGKYLRLQDTRDKNEYGYLWWHDTYLVKGKAINTIEARGAGGQFIFIIPELESVVVITSGNFRNRKGNQARDILKEYILPAMTD
ncbi:serine hydrolase [Flavobacteriaceae bacterium R38]|nr:serine hydrolase [Flavobacteriaceae bacterium R38]